MVVRVYVSGISGNKEVKKRQQRVTMILDSKNIKYNIIDIAEPGKENEKGFMQENGKAKDSKHPLPPQIFNDDNYCGDYEEFDMANELDELEKFLNISSDKTPTENVNVNGSTVEIVNEDKRESMEETLGTVNDNDKEAVSLDNEDQSIPDEIPDILGEREGVKQENDETKSKEEATEPVIEE